MPSWNWASLGRIAACFIVAATGFILNGQMEPPVAPHRGESITRSIEGTVLTKEGSPVPGAVVLLKDGKTLQVRSYVAQADGKYHFFGLSSDIDYELRAQANGMTSPTKMVSVFDSHRVIKLNLKLKKPMKK
ncbi:MAG: carboxypeptidase-like regulatory domain-containing protein [Bryobacteraceae bacterium]